MHLYWLDMEMTGLDAQQDKILEAAAVITNEKLEIVEQWHSTIFQTQDVLDGMNDWCQKQHRKSGLIDRIPDGISEAELDTKLLELADKHFKKNERPILCGNSIWQDRRFVDNCLPQFSNRLHYRMMDVSSWKIIFEAFFKKKFQKKGSHLALDDTLESLEELKFYLQYLDKSAIGDFKNGHMPEILASAKS